MNDTLKAQLKDLAAIVNAPGGKALWDVLTGLRGPDSPSEIGGVGGGDNAALYEARRKRKFDTVEIIRHRAGLHGGIARHHDDDEVCLPPASEWDHFDNHVYKAASALGLNIRTVKTKPGKAKGAAWVPVMGSLGLPPLPAPPAATAGPQVLGPDVTPIPAPLDVPITYPPGQPISFALWLKGARLNPSTSLPPVSEFMLWTTFHQRAWMRAAVKLTEAQQAWHDAPPAATGIKDNTKLKKRLNNCNIIAATVEARFGAGQTLVAYVNPHSDLHTKLSHTWVWDPASKPAPILGAFGDLTGVGAQQGVVCLHPSLAAIYAGMVEALPPSVLPADTETLDDHPF